MYCCFVDHHVFKVSNKIIDFAHGLLGTHQRRYVVPGFDVIVHLHSSSMCRTIASRLVMT